MALRARSVLSRGYLPRELSRQELRRAGLARFLQVVLFRTRHRSQCTLEIPGPHFIGISGTGQIKTLMPFLGSYMPDSEGWVGAALRERQIQRERVMVRR
jgi:hypothetical protein